MEIKNIDDVVNSNGDNSIVDCSNINNSDNKASENSVNNFIANEYFVIPNIPEGVENINIDDVLLKKFEELGIAVKYHYKSTGIYCVIIKDQETLKELESLDYITLEQVRGVRALNSEG